jgi:hypothetical protein
LPISSLLFRSLISYAAHDSYEGLQRFKSFPVLPALVERKTRQIQPLQQDTYEPFLSKAMDLWIISSFTEDKAHRQALRLTGQAKKLIAVFCHPTFTRHHRCVDQSSNVVSLSEFLRMLSPAIFGRAIEDIIWRPPPDVQVYVERGGLVYVSIRGLQFSFHAIPRTSVISAYECSKQNVPQAWAELRLQPVAPLVLKWARALLLEEKLTES